MRITALETQEKEIKKKYNQEMKEIVSEYHEIVKNNYEKTYTIPNFSDLQFISSMSIEEKKDRKNN